jgi:ribulose 1,5-bisphosphate synthetase/thiazole synthase
MQNMKQIKETAKAVDVIAETDILVVGSGPAGLAAAVSIKDNVTYSAVDIKKVQKALKKQQVRIF